MTPAAQVRPLSDEWIEEMMFDHIAVVAADSDKWVRVNKLTELGHRFKATISADRKEIERLRKQVEWLESAAEEHRLD